MVISKNWLLWFIHYFAKTTDEMENKREEWKPKLINFYTMKNVYILYLREEIFAARIE